MDPNDEMNEYLCNVSVIKALLHYCSVRDQDKIERWVNRIQEDDNGLQNVKAKNEYLLYLLINLQKETLTSPFDKNPTNARLQPLCRILADNDYDDLKKQFKTNNCKMKKMVNENQENYENPDLSCKPCDFHSEQPRPLRGLTASLAVFSNFDYNP